MTSQLVLSPGRVKYTLLWLGCTLAVVVFTFQIRAGQAWGWPYLVGSGVGFIAMSWELFCGRFRLCLDEEGVSFATVRRDCRYRWSDVQWFEVRRIGRARRVCFKFSPRFEGEQAVRDINQRFGGWDRFLPDN